MGSAVEILHPVMGPAPAPEGEQARWIGEVDEASVTGEYLQLEAAQGYARARLLIRDGAAPRGFVDIAIRDDEHGSRISVANLRTEIERLPAAESAPGVTGEQLITVAVSTRNRPEYVRRVLPSLLTLDYPNHEILFVDNASTTDETFDLVSALDEPRVRIVREPRPGLSRGRNLALLEATGEIVAFTDDDVVVDPGWLNAVARGFGRSGRTGLVTGMVPSGELRSSAQSYFESRSSWIHSTNARQYTLDAPPPDVRSFPLDMSRYGTGANFAVRRDLAIRLGGFNEVLGVGSPTGGGEDLDMFVRVLYSGHALNYEPSSIVWHRHRDDLNSLTDQMGDYALSFSAWMTSLVANPDVRRDAIRIGRRHVVRRLRERGRATHQPDTAVAIELPSLKGVERAGLLRGPAAYLRARRGGLSERPLAGYANDQTRTQSMNMG